MARTTLADVLVYLRKTCAIGAARDLSDGELLQLFLAQREQAAFTVLVQRHGPMVLGVCRRLLGDADDAEDAFQATFLVLVRRAASIRQHEPLANWLYAVAHRVALRARAQTAARRHRERRLEAMPRSEPIDELTLQELRAVLDEEIGRLVEKHRAPIVLCHLAGKSLDNAAKELGWSKSTLAKRLTRARELLRQRLVRRGLTLSAGVLATALSDKALGAQMAALLAIKTAKAATAIAAGKAVAGSCLSAKAITLAEEAIMGMSAVKAKAVLMVLALGLAFGGAGLAGYARVDSRDMPDAGSSSAGTMAASDMAQSTLSANQKKDKPQRMDLYGDPLPEGAVARLGTLRYRTNSSPGFSWLGFLPDGKTTITASANGSIQLWDPALGKMIREFETGTLTSRKSCAMSADGKLIALGGSASVTPAKGLAAAGIWDVATGKEIRVIRATDGNEASWIIELSPDGKTLFALGNMGLVQIMEVATGNEIRRREFPRGDILSKLAVSPDGSLLAVGTGSNTNKLLVWKWQTEEEPRDFKAPGRHGRNLAFSPDSKLLAETVEDECLFRIWDVESGNLLHKLTPAVAKRHNTSSVLFSADGKTLIGSIFDNLSGAVHFWDVATGKHLKSYDKTAHRLAVSSDGKLLAGRGGNIRVWDLASGKELSASDEAHEYSIRQLAAAGTLVATTEVGGTIRLWDVKSGKHLAKLEDVGQGSDYIALSPDARKLASSGDEGVIIWDTSTAKQITTLPSEDAPKGSRNLTFTGDGKHVLSLDSQFHLRKWDVATGKAILKFALQPSGIKIPERKNDDPKNEFMRAEALLLQGLGKGAFSSDGRTFVLDSRRGYNVFDVASGKELFQLPNQSNQVVGLALSPDGRVLLTSVGSRVSKQNKISLWELATRQLRKEFELPGGNAGAVAFSPDGKCFAAAAGDLKTQITVWDAANGEEIRTYKDVRGPVRSLAFADGSNLLVSGMDDTTALVWDVKSKR